MLCCYFILEDISVMTPQFSFIQFANFNCIFMQHIFFLTFKYSLSIHLSYISFKRLLDLHFDVN